MLVGWFVVFGLNGPLRQYFSLYRAASEREREKEMIDERKNVKQPPPTASAIGPCPTVMQTSRTSRHWKLTPGIKPGTSGY